MIPLFKVYVNPGINESLLKTIHSGWLGEGSKVKEFEEKLGKRVGNHYCLGLSAGTHGLHLALVLAGVEEGDEVITTPLTCTATNWPLFYQKARIVWADIKIDDLNIDPFDVERKITEKTRAIMCVHWGGYPCDMTELSNIAIDFKLPLIEDAAHAFGAMYHNVPVGNCTYADYTMFSFQAIKHLTCGDGGALFVKKTMDYERAKLLRWYGIDREGPRKDMRCEEDITEVGWKYHMNDIAATIGLSNLETIDEILQRHQGNAAYYRNKLRNFDGVTLLQGKMDRVSSSWLFTMLVEDRTGFSRLMGEKGIHVTRVHERNDKHTSTRKFVAELPNLEKVIDKMICIPCGWWVSQTDREYIVNSIKEGW